MLPSYAGPGVLGMLLLAGILRVRMIMAFLYYTVRDHGRDHGREEM